MAANYWESTQRKHWQFTKDQLATMRQKLEEEDQQLVHMFPLPQLRHLNIYFNQQISRIAKRLSIRQQAMATAQMYLKRFYTRVEIRRTNPYLVLATAVYLACKMEECPQHIRVVVSEARLLWPADFIGIDTSKLGECEFFLISEMNSQLILHQPYRTLTTLQGEFGLGPEEAALAWSVINDSYMTDLPLLYPPHVIACTAVLLAIVLRPGGNTPTNAQSGLAAASAALNQARGAQGNGPPTLLGGGGTPGSSQGSQFDGSSQPARMPPSQQQQQTPDARVGKVTRFATWLGESGIDIEAMVDSTQELIAFYECHEQYNDKVTREQINRYVKARGLDK